VIYIVFQCFELNKKEQIFQTLHKTNLNDFQRIQLILFYGTDHFDDAIEKSEKMLALLKANNSTNE